MRCQHEKLSCSIPWYWREPQVGDHGWLHLIIQDKAIHIQIPRDDDASAGRASQISEIFKRRDQALQMDNAMATVRACQAELEVLICEATVELLSRVAPRLHGGVSLPSDLYSRLHVDLYFKATLAETDEVVFQAQEPDADPQYDLAQRSERCDCGERPCSSPDLPDSHVILEIDAIPNLFSCFDKEVSVLERLMFDNITRVVIPSLRGRQEMVCKAATSTFTLESILRELQCLSMVAALDPAANTPLSRIPKPLGFVRSSDHDGVIGLVETYVPHTSTLYRMDLTQVDVSRREKWIRQINETLTALHQIGITWSDIKADNVLVHSVTDDAWLIDFGGGSTDMWAEVEGLGTIDGDLATARKLEDYLRLGRQYQLTKR